jgi:hypothetical protein
MGELICRGKSVPPIPPIVFATPEMDVQTGNDIRSLVIDATRWDPLRILDCSVIFARESAYNTNAGSIDDEATTILLANNSLHYGRTTDVERFFVIFDAAGQKPIGIGFGSLGSPQSWSSGLGEPIVIPKGIPLIGGRRIAVFKDDIPLTLQIDPRVEVQNGVNILPWDVLESVSTDSPDRRLYISTPNHLFDFVNRNSTMVHVDQKYGVGRFQQLVSLPCPQFATAEDVAKAYPDESNQNVRAAIRLLAECRYGRPWLF